MLKTKKLLAGLLCIILLFSLTLTGCGKSGDQPKGQESKVSFPERDLAGYIMWGAGGAMDNVSRAITPLAEKYLGKTIVLQNKTGATGAVATQYVYDQKPDGYTLLYGAENPVLYKVLEISQIDYDQFEPINVLLRGVAVIVVNKDAKWNTLQELIDDAKANPGKIKMGSTGPGGLPYVVAALLKTVDDAEFNLVAFDGEGPAMTAMLGGHVDMSAVGLTAAAQYVKAGKIKALAVVSNERVESLPDIPAITELIPAYSPYMPWGPFYGVFVKKETPEEVKEVLKDAFKKAFEEEKFQQFIKDFGGIPVGLSGKEAEDFIKHMQSVSAWLLYDAGGAKKSPAEFGIKRVGQ